MHYIAEIGLTSRFFQVYEAYHAAYHKNSGTLPLTGPQLSGTHLTDPNLPGTHSTRMHLTGI